jgi:DNA-binding MarR family transcriptional regulator
VLSQVLAEAPRHAASTVRLNVAVAHQLGMAQADLQCMWLLAQGPSAPTQLAAALGLTTGAMTKLLYRLEAAGYITRSYDPANRRRIIITADPAGLARLAVRYDGIGERIRAYLSARTNAELEVILAFMQVGEQAADEELARIRSSGIRHRTRRPPNPKLRPVGQVMWRLTWGFAALAGLRSGYFKVSGTGTPMSSKASRCALVGSASIGMVAWVPAKRTWLRVRVARCSSRLRKLW